MSHSGYSLIDNSSYRIRHSAVNCSGNVTYLWSSKTRYRSSMSITDSKLYVPRVWFRDAHYFQDYCVDDFFSSDGSNQIKAIVCGEENQYWFITLMMSAVPCLFVLSAIFMFLTLAVYCYQTSLRRTMHGFTLGCHLASMGIHFVGLAITYCKMITLTPITCLTFGTVVHFFNVASFSWVTVIGFDTWRKIKSCEGNSRRSSAKQSLDVKTAICYSVYGWGLPLLVVVASRSREVYNYLYSTSGGEVHDTVASYGQRIRLCWYSQDYIKEMAFVNGPLVVLLIGNLFFFIPSVLRVYHSGKFTTESSSVSVKLENQRLRAIFRMFVLMEFHSIPCLLRFLSITTGVQISVYIHIAEIVFNASSGLFLFANFAWKPHVYPWLFSHVRKSFYSVLQTIGKSCMYSFAPTHPAV